MKVSIARSELLDSLNIVSKGMSARSTLPILSGVLLTATDGIVSFQSTDLEISVSHSSPALVEEEGQTVIPGKLLGDIVRSLPEAAVVLETEADHITIRCQQVSFSLKTLNPADFPKFPEISVGSSVTLPASEIASMVKRVSKAVSRDETRAVLTGILLVIEGPVVKMVATDSYRLAVAEKIFEEEISADMEVVIPGRALEEATKLAASAEKVTLGTSENQVVFNFGETTFVTRRIEGTFPNYKQLIPRETESTVIIPSEEFLGAVKRVSLMALHNTPLRVSVASEDQTMSLSATTQDVGDASEDVMAKADGKDVEIAFNHTFLVDGLVSVPTENVRLELQSALKPGLLRSDVDNSFLYLLMPVRLG